MKILGMNINGMRLLIVVLFAAVTGKCFDHVLGFIVGFVIGLTGFIGEG